MIIEDNPNDAELMIRSLRKKNILNRIEVFRDGEEAMKLFVKNTNFSENYSSLRVVFIDLKLPKISGLELLKLIKTTPGIKNIPVVVVTSSNQDQDLKKAYTYGANSYVVKPIDFNEFTETIENTGSYWLNYNRISELTGIQGTGI